MAAASRTQHAPKELGDLPEKARALISILRERELKAEADRVLHAETISEIRDAGLFRVLQPLSYGGFGGTLPDMIDIAYEIGRGSSAAAWIFGNVSLHSWIIGMFGKAAQDEIWADPDTITSSCLRPVCTARPVPGGFMIGGRWPYVSGVDHTQWTVLGVMLSEDGTSKQPAYALVPRNDYVIHDEWHVSGLAATGSKDLIIEECFVPEHRVMTAAQANSGKPPGVDLHGVLTWRSVAWRVEGAALGERVPVDDRAAVAVGEARVLQARAGPVAGELRGIPDGRNRGGEVPCDSQIVRAGRECDDRPLVT